MLIFCWLEVLSRLCFERNWVGRFQCCSRNVSAALETSGRRRSTQSTAQKPGFVAKATAVGAMHANQAPNAVFLVSANAESASQRLSDTGNAPHVAERQKFHCAS
ncbi:unnamed protein product, partial [Laminaria digitata]